MEARQWFETEGIGVTPFLSREALNLITLRKLRGALGQSASLAGDHRWRGLQAGQDGRRRVQDPRRSLLLRIRRLRHPGGRGLHLP